MARFVTVLEAQRNTREDLVLNFATMKYARPFGTLHLAHTIKAVVASRKQQGLNTAAAGLEAATAVHGYLKHVGFFTWIGLKDVGKLPGEAPGSETYVPITDIDRAALIANGRHLHDSIVHESERLAAVIYSSASDTGGAIMLEYCFREVIRNVFEHAEIDRCTVMAQRWANEVEVAIIDAGRGVLASLSERVSDLDAESALRLAVKPGVSRTVPSHDDNMWSNAGFGLYILSALGSFTLMSTGRALRLTDQEEEYLDAVPFAGTGVRVTMSTANADYFPNRLAQIVAKGEAAAGVRVPGAASKSARR